MSAIIHLYTGKGLLYLCAVRADHSYCVLNWAKDSAQDTNLVEQPLRMVHTLRDDFVGGLGFHADHVTQFTAVKLWVVCHNLGIDSPWGVPVCAVITRRPIALGNPRRQT